MSRQFLAFLITGGLAAAVNFGSRILYNQWVEFSSAVILAYLTGMITAFLLARTFVFTDGSQSVKRSATFFVLVNAVAVLQTWRISMKAGSSRRSVVCLQGKSMLCINCWARSSNTIT
jgi:putative flippase GtrA